MQFKQRVETHDYGYLTTLVESRDFEGPAEQKYPPNNR